MCGVPPPHLPQKYLRIWCGVPTLVEHLTRCSKFECAVSPLIILKHLVSSAQLVSPSVALPAELVGFIMVLVLVLYCMNRVGAKTPNCQITIAGIAAGMFFVTRGIMITITHWQFG